MTYSRTLKLVRKASQNVGLNPKAYGLHNLRSGGASAATAMGIPDRVVQADFFVLPLVDNAVENVKITLCC